MGTIEAYSNGKRGDTLRPTLKEYGVAKEKAGGTLRGSAAARSVSRDVYGDGRSPKLARELRTIEKVWQDMDLDHEELAIFSKKGRQVFYNPLGDSNNAKYSAADAKGNIITHFHTGQHYTKGTLVSRVGSSLSFKDVSDAIKGGAAEIRATTPSFVFSMRPKKNGRWGVTAEEFKDVYQQYLTKFVLAYGKTPTMRNVATDKKSKERWLMVGNHYAMKRTANELGWRYQAGRN